MRNGYGIHSSTLYWVASLPTNSGVFGRLGRLLRIKTINRYIEKKKNLSKMGGFLEM